MKVLFLDIDGVLNYNGCRERVDGYYFVNDDKILLLKQILDATDAKVVLSSTWRLGWIEGWESHKIHFEKLRDKLAEYDIHFLSRTPVLKDGYRGKEIDDWLQHWTGEPIESFVIIDDDADMKPYMNRLVRTSWMKGLEQKHVDKAIKMLNHTTKNKTN